MSKWGSGIGLALVAAASCGVWQLYRIEKAPAPDEEQVDVIPEVTVQAGLIVQTNLQAAVFAYGPVAPDPGRDDPSSAQARVTAPAAGRVAEVLCAVGSAVKCGDTLFRMDTRLAEMSVAKAQQAVMFAEKGLARQKRLQQIDGTSDKLMQEAQQQLDSARQELLTAQTEKSLLSVTAPMSGTVMGLEVRSGETVDAGRQLAELVDLKRLVVIAAVPCREAALVKPGMAADIEVDAAPQEGARYRGEVTYVDPRVDTQTDTMKVRVKLPADSESHPGQFARARIVCAELRDKLAVPEESLERLEDGRLVISVIEGNEAVQKSVKIGTRDGAWVEIQGEGISAGTRIVTAGGYGLPDHTRIRVLAP